MNEVISVLYFAVLLGGKYLLRKALESVSQVVNESGSSFLQLITGSIPQ